MQNLNERIEELLLRVSKPARYSGGEYNTPNMDKPGAARFCMCFPDVYEVAISNLGTRILYHLLNDSEDLLAERCYAPWEDMGKLLREEKLPLFSLETRSPLSSFDTIGFSLQYEMCYTNVLYMLDLANIPFYAKDRGEKDPVVVFGGPCACNLEPMADFADAILIGDGEENLPAFLRLQAKCKKEGKSKAEFLKEAASIDGVYVPTVVYPEYDEEGKLVGFSGTVKKATVDFDTAYYPEKPLVPNIEAVHDRGVLELFRGCPRGCRFCQACFTYRPLRGRSAEKLIEQGKNVICNTGFDELSLNSLSTSDYPELKTLISGLKEEGEKKRFTLALPSLRLDSFEEGYAEMSRMSSLTFAPEAGTQRLRDVINKNVTEEDIETGMANAFRAGYTSVKLYFMIGLPTETMEDVKGIFDTAMKVRSIYRAVTGKKNVRVSASVANFVPKPFTPFQWVRQDSEEEFRMKHDYLKELFKKSGATLAYHDSDCSVLEAVFARGDRKLSRVIARAYEDGCYFDGWNDFFRYDIWLNAFQEEGIDMKAYTGSHGVDEVLAWDYVNLGVTKRYFKREYLRALEGVTTPDCRSGCQGCGANALKECDICW